MDAEACRMSEDADDEDNETEEGSADPGDLLAAPFKLLGRLASAVASAIPTPDDTEETEDATDE
jgi:hypothetical protein